MKNETLLLNAIQSTSLDQLTKLIADYLEQAVLIVDQSGALISRGRTDLKQVPADWLDALATDNRYHYGHQEYIRDVLNPQALNPWYFFVSQSKGFPLAANQVQLAIQVLNNFTDRYALNPNQGAVNAIFAQLLAAPEQTDAHLLQTLTTEKLVCVTVSANHGAPYQADLLQALRQLATPLPLTETPAGLVLLLPAASLDQTQSELTTLGNQYALHFFISEPYDDITQTPAFLNICRQAEQLAQQLGTVTVVNPTQKYNIYIILSHVDNGALLKNTMCTQLIALKKYDGQHHAELFPTLFAYLENDCHVTATAEKLHLHRNSLAKRLNKIQDLLAIDFSDADKTFGLRLSYRLFHFLQI